MAGFLDSALGLTPGEDVILRVLVAIGILAIGYIGVKVTTSALKSNWITGNLSKREVSDRLDMLKYISYFLNAIVILIALFYLNTNLTNTLFVNVAGSAPEVLSFILIAVLGVLAINLIVKFAKESLRTFGIQSYFKSAGISESGLDLIGTIVKAFLYLILLQISLEYIGIGDTFVSHLVTASSYALAFLVAALVFWGFKDLFQNFAAGVYLKNSRMVRPGEEVRTEEHTGTIKDISLFSTTIDSESGYTLLRPNREVMESDLKFKRTKNDVETLENIKDYFVAADSTTAAPATLEMTLDIFGYRFSQQKITEKSDSTEKDDLADAVEDLTNNEVLADYVESTKITSLGGEMRAWFNDGALVAPVFDKSRVFPDASGADWALAVGIENDEVLIVDPGAETSGVYFIEQEQLQEAMMEQMGYIVLAPKGTNAHWRIKNDLIYSDKSYYDELSKTLEAKLTKILRQGRILSDVMPGSVQEYIEDWRSERYVSKLWKPTEDPEEGEDETSESDGK